MVQKSSKVLLRDDMRINQAPSFSELQILRFLWPNDY